MKRFYETVRWFRPVLIILVPFANAVAMPAITKPAPALPTVKIICSNKFSGGESGECKVGVGEDHSDEIRINVASTNTSLVQLDVNQVTLAPHQLVAKVNLKSYSTPIKTTVNIKAILSSNSLVTAEQSIEVVSALIESARITTSSFIGTNGAKTTCLVKLRAPAPTGGIDIYLSPLVISPIPNRRGGAALDVQNPRVPAGSTTVGFDIAYDKIELEGEPVSAFRPESRSFSNFNEETRTVELVVALVPTDSKVWSPVPGIAHKVSFQVVPLRVVSITFQPTTFSRGNEGLASLTLSALPGPSERALIQPIKGTSSKVWVTGMGSSCAAPSSALESLEFPLTPGTSTQSFKVCSAPVTSVVTGDIRVFLKSGLYQSPVTIQP